MMSDARFNSSCVRVVGLVVGLALLACSASPGGGLPFDASDGSIEFGGRPRDARAHDAATSTDATTRDAAAADAAAADAAAAPDAAAIDAGIPEDATPAPGDAPGGEEPDPPGGIVSCFSDFNPTATCAVPTTHCCFTNYNAQHAGSCETASCGWGTIDCDGPEDCASGQHCCAHVVIDPQDGITGYRLSCQASACGAAPAHRELCHPGASGSGTCGRGSSCVSAAENAFDLPRTLSVCE